MLVKWSRGRSLHLRGARAAPERLTLQETHAEMAKCGTSFCDYPSVLVVLVVLVGFKGEIEKVNWTKQGFGSNEEGKNNKDDTSGRVVRAEMKKSLTSNYYTGKS